MWVQHAQLAIGSNESVDCVGGHKKGLAVHTTHHTVCVSATDT